MNMRSRLTMICVLTTVGACSTTTPIGEVPAGASGSSGSAGTGDSSGSAGTGSSGSAGTGSSGSAGTGSGTYVPSAGEALNDTPFTIPSGISGDWVGYLENYSLYFTGSDELKFHFGVDAQGNGTITLSQGAGTPPPPPTDPFEDWPVPAIDAQGNPGFGIAYPQAPLAGFVYTAHQVTWQAKRLKFRRLNAEPWEPWCALQTSYLLPNSGSTPSETWTCNSGNGITSTGPGTCKFTDGPPNGRCTPNHQYMCSMSKFCGCNATGCGATTGRSSSFDITFFADHAVGSMDTYHLVLMPATP